MEIHNRACPWFGGFYERRVQSGKRCLRETLESAKLTYEELNTHLIEVEGVLNSRPLTNLFDEGGEPLTPSHLIMGRRVLYHVSTGSDPKVSG